MKYIRTKDRIYKTLDLKSVNLKDVYFDNLWFDIIIPDENKAIHYVDYCSRNKELNEKLFNSFFSKTIFIEGKEDDGGNTHYTAIEKEEIIAQSDTIEELCDSWIITSKQGHIYDSYGDYTYELKEVLPQAREECPDEDWDLYGCVLVDGIIKQVAKLNGDKGELCLI